MTGFRTISIGYQTAQECVRRIGAGYSPALCVATILAHKLSCIDNEEYLAGDQMYFLIHPSHRRIVDDFVDSVAAETAKKVN